MKAIFWTFLPSMIWLHTAAQEVNEPQILILSPANIQVSNGLGPEIAALDAETKASRPNPRAAERDALRKQPENIQKMAASELLFLENMNFVKRASYISEQFLTYRLFEKFPNLLIQLKDTQTNGQPEDLRRIAEATGLQYVLNFPRLSFYKGNGISYANLAVQLYDHESNTLLIDTAFVGDWNSPGFEFGCKTGTLSCTLNNSVSQALDRVESAVTSNSPMIKRERQLWKERLDVLQSAFFRREFDKTYVVNVVPAADSNVELSHLYQLLVSSDREKFVAFFLESKDVKGFKGLTEHKEDNNVQVLTRKNIKDTGYLNDIPQTYAYIVKAVRYKGKWYYEKSNVTYFEPQDGQGGKLQYFNNLQDWGFFKENSTSISDDFWETHLFEKVKDLRKDPDWDKYGSTIWKQDEEDNRPYIGLYQIVADKLKGPGKFQPRRINMN